MCALHLFLVIRSVKLDKNAYKAFKIVFITIFLSVKVMRSAMSVDHRVSWITMPSSAIPSRCPSAVCRWNTGAARTHGNEQGDILIKSVKRGEKKN